MPTWALTLWLAWVIACIVVSGVLLWKRNAK